MSPGMKKRIRQGDYTFPDPEWSNVSESGNLLRILYQEYPAYIQNVYKYCVHNFSELNNVSACETIS